MMQLLHGTGASRGIAAGPVAVLSAAVHVEERRLPKEGVAAEIDRFEAAIATTDAAMEQIALTPEIPREGRDLVDAHRAILKSDEILHETRTLIRERGLGAEWAVRVIVDGLRRVFADMSDERFRERFDDVQAVTNRLLRTLLALPETNLEKISGCVAVAAEVSPLDALQLHRAGVVGLVTERGGPTSHAAIVARALGVPYVFGVERLLEAALPAETICLDGASGEVAIAPDAPTLQRFRQRRAEDLERRRLLDSAGREPSLTLDGTRIEVGANVESEEEVRAAVAAGADHIGLVRTELLYLDRTELPSEEEQLKDAVSMLRAAAGRSVTFRTLDIGGDKLPLAVPIEPGPNPALGVRGIRFSLRRHDIFRIQLRALYRAAARGPMRIMFPMVASADEVVEARAICNQVCAELGRAGIEHDPRVPLGSMIETPSAALTADHLAACCDFLSIGTNDLIHHAFAADRQNQDVAYLYRPMHPSILRLLRNVFEARCPVSLCGEIAGDPRYTWILLGLGLRSFSMTVGELPTVKSVIRKTQLAEARRLAEDALQLNADQAIEALVRERMGDRFDAEIGPSAR